MLNEVAKQFAELAASVPQTSALNAQAQAVANWQEQLRSELEAAGQPQNQRQLARQQFIYALDQMCGAFVGGLMTATFNYAVRLHEADLEDSHNLLVELRRNAGRRTNGRPPTHD